MTKSSFAEQIDVVIDLLSSEMAKGNMGGGTFDAILASYEKAKEKLQTDPDYDGFDVSGGTQMYVTGVGEDNVDRDVVEALWKAESQVKVLNILNKN